MKAIDAAVWNSTSFWSEDAEHEFARARRRATRERLLAWVLNRCARLESFDALRTRRRLLPTAGRRIATVPLDRIVGTLGKGELFTRSFHPKANRLKARWKSVYALVRGLRGSDPVELYEVGDVYYVVDGHFRISVARSLKSPSIEASIRRWQ